MVSSNYKLYSHDILRRGVNDSCHPLSILPFPFGERKENHWQLPSYQYWHHPGVRGKAARPQLDKLLD